MNQLSWMSQRPEGSKIKRQVSEQVATILNGRNEFLDLLICAASEESATRFRYAQSYM